MNFTQIRETLEEVSKISSTNERIEFLKNHDDPDFKKLLAWYLDNSRITGIAEKKFDKIGAFTPEMETQDQKTFSDVIRYLDCHHTGKDEDVAWIKYLGMNICKTIDDMIVFRALVCKNYPMGLRDGLVNKAFPGLVPTYDVMLADKFYDLKEKQKSKIFNGREFVVECKLDGCRCTAHKENGVVRLVSRQGKLITGLVDIEKDIASIDSDNFVIDGELLLTNCEGIPSKLQYKATMKIVSSKDPEKHGITLNAFDIVSEQEWKAQKSLHPFITRYETLEKKIAGLENVKIVENLYKGSDVSVIDTMIVDAKAKEWEGLMIRFTDSPYEWKRSKNLLKVKPFLEMDAYITGFEEGTNANKGRLGAFKCEIDHPKFGNIKVDVGGGYSEEERINFWEQRDSLIGRIISIQYFEVTNREDGQLSLRFPEFLELKEEGSKVNN